MGIAGGARRLFRGAVAAGCSAVAVTAGSSGTPDRRPGPADRAAATGRPAPATPEPARAPATSASPSRRGAAIDLRSFFRPLPAGARAEGGPKGSPSTAAETAAETAAVSDDSDGTPRRLRSHGFRDAAVRTYSTAGGDTEVSVQLARVAGARQTAGFSTGSTYQGAPAAPAGGYPAHGCDLASGSAESHDTLPATAYTDDVRITLTVTGGAHPSRTLPQTLLDEQHRRLATNR